MRVVVTGVDGVIGRGVAERLATMGHSVVGIASGRPVGWPQSMEFVETHIRDVGTIQCALSGADAVAHCTDDETGAVLQAMASEGVGRIVTASSSVIDRRPLVESGADWVAIRCGLVLGRVVDDAVLRLFTGPVVLDVGGSAGRHLQVVHPHDVHRLVVRAVLDRDHPSGPVDIAAEGTVTARDIATAVGRRVLRIPRLIGTDDLPDVPWLDATALRQEWDCPPVWRADDCVRDFALVTRGRIAVGNHVLAVPWRFTRVRDLPAVDAPSTDGVKPVLAGIGSVNGEFDTPIDPRFPTYVATNLSEALPGPFSPSSASVSVRGTRAAALVIADHLRPGGVVQREMALRTTGVFGHRLYAGLTSGHFMAQTVPVIDPDTIIEGFFGNVADGLPLFADERPPTAHQGIARHLRNVATFSCLLVGVSLQGHRDTRNFVDDVDRLEAAAADPSNLDDGQLGALILSARDCVVDGWVLGSASILMCTAYGVILRVLCGRDTSPLAGQDVVSAESLGAVHRLAAMAREDPTLTAALSSPNCGVEVLAVLAPDFHSALLADLARIGHRGPGEVEMRSPSYADNPDLLVRMVAKTLQTPPPDLPEPPAIPVWARPVAAAGATQIREREVRRDKMVRAIWVLRALLRERGQRLVRRGVLADVDDVFYLLVDELDAAPADLAGLVARRRREQRELAALSPPEAFSGKWQPVRTAAAALATGETLRGLGVCGGRVRGRARVIVPETIDELRPGEVMVAKATDVGYTPAFAYAAAVVTELGGPLSHAAIVAREYGFPCVVGAKDATVRLADGALIEVDGATGHVTVLEG